LACLEGAERLLMSRAGGLPAMGFDKSRTPCLPQGNVLTVREVKGFAGYFHSLGLRTPQSASAVEAPVWSGAPSTGPLRILSITPNPIVTSAEIFFEARDSGPVSLAVCDVGGRQLTSVALGSFGPGRHRVPWEARDAMGAKVSSGIYFVGR
jgi:hypothetical protein